jgi:hypothetical protein
MSFLSGITFRPSAGVDFVLTARDYVIQVETNPPQCVLGLMSFDASGAYCVAGI